uniref:Uncharacterized protein n=1 Tax=Ananas comosus var. bracteatus TaxID=296719 RepID=A0A6V7QMB5_ANACO|nr:unnamed protein product [Ananas comosus var. bracteatus]
MLRSSGIGTLAAIFHFSGTKPSYLGVQKSPPSLALCPATNNCISTSEEISDPNHYAPPWNYNPEDGGRNKPISKDEAMAELIQVVTSTKPDNFTPRIVEKNGDYLRVEYESPIMGFVDDVEFWFPPGKNSIVEYRSGSRLETLTSMSIKRELRQVPRSYTRWNWRKRVGHLRATFEELLFTNQQMQEASAGAKRKGKEDGIDLLSFYIAA